MSTTIAIDAPDQALAALRAALGADAVITDVASRQFYSTDVYRSGALPLAIVRPRGTAELAAALRALTPYGLPVVPRGGGMSYTDAYLPIRSHTVMVDVLAMNRVLEVNAADGYVTVECGATWKALHDALVPQGVRTPYWGPLSGLRSTVGGALSQGSIFLGSGRYGTVAESVLGLDVVLVDGQVLRLGSHANKNGAPFFRQYGPDLLGLFLSDTGSLGIKTTATLRLIRRPTEIRCLSFAFRDAPTMFAAMAEVARAELVAELFAFDPRLQRQRLKRSSLTADVRTLGKVMQAAGSTLEALKEGFDVVRAGRDFLDPDCFSVHLVVEGRDAADADAKAAAARALLGTSGSEVANSVPKVLRAEPFAELNSMLGPQGERWVPVHGIVPFSVAAQMYADCEAVFERHAEARSRYRIEHGYLCTTVATSGTLIEPVIYWPDARNCFHERVLAPDYLAKLPLHDENPAAREAVAQLRAELAAAFLRRGAVSFQIGKFYPYQQALDPSAAQLLESVKRVVDPQGRMNPGSLGLAQ